ncbi:hypothetical protein Glove_158g95 [Diversispora epigaea]|uniref:Uncharacterized protein n=1 Tax=Diversispora epigaea TaxID=1348612 RepID=A0A397IRM4_9GLOM|nr:hypothetical protein Glove_158g95 [Diversispora epigaea]
MRQFSRILSKGLSKNKLKFSACITNKDAKEVFNRFGYYEALLFKPEIVEIDDNGEEFKQCISELKT